MSLTIKEIAKLANVSRGTVDRVIHGRDNVNEETRERVLEVLKQYNYQSNIYAQSLANLKNNFKIGVITNSLGNEFFDQVLEGLKYQASYYKNIELVIEEIKGYDPLAQVEKINLMLTKNVNAIIITPINDEMVRKSLSEVKIPIVTVNNDINVEKLAFVGCNYLNSGELSADLAKIALPSGGKIAIVVGSFNLRGHNERINGFKNIFNLDNTIIDTFENQDDDNISYELTKKIISDKQVDLIYYGAAGIAGGLKAIKELESNIRVITVDDIKVVRDGLKNGEILGSVTQQPYKQGSNAIKIIYDYLVYNRVPLQKNVLMNNKVILKHSYYITDED